MIPTKITYPLSFWMTIGVVVATALLTVAWHGLLFIVAVIDLIAIAALPTVTRYEMKQAADEAKILGSK